MASVIEALSISSEGTAVVTGTEEETGAGMTGTDEETGTGISSHDCKSLLTVRPRSPTVVARKDQTAKFKLFLVWPGILREIQPKKQR